jgi:cytochrome bd-type quinol oxidase subunit 1
MEEVTYSHIPIATLITAFMVLAPIYEYIGMRRQDPRYDRLAKSLIWFALILFSPGAALGTGIPMVIIGLWPEFWSRWANLFFWALIAQFVFFTLEVTFLFFFYYLPWDRWREGIKKKRHLLFGIIAAFWGVMVQLVWDATGAYMMTPGGVNLPAVDNPVGFSWAAFFNPSFLSLFVHRFVGNISYTMMLVGGVFALRYMATKYPKEREYFGWSSDLTFSIGFLTFFLMPVIGWTYARVLQGNAPVAFSAIMGGHARGFFIIKMALIAIFLVIGGVYLFIKHRDKLPVLIVATLGIAALYIFFGLHPALYWLGQPTTWRIFYTVALLALLGLVWLARFRGKPITRKRWPWALFLAGAAAFFAFALGGFVRERARNPYTVYGELTKPEMVSYEEDRFLLYDKCIDCHHQTVREFARYKPRDWQQRVEIEAGRPGVNLTEGEKLRIIGYLEGRHP